MFIPAGRITTKFGYKDSAKVLGRLAILLAHAIIASGHLPLVVLLIPLSTLGQTLLAVTSWSSGQLKVISLDGRNRAIVITESLARVIAAIRITSVRWRSYLPQREFDSPAKR